MVLKFMFTWVLECYVATLQALMVWWNYKQNFFQNVSCPATDGVCKVAYYFYYFQVNLNFSPRIIEII